MGLDVSSGLVLAAAVERGDFFAPTGTRRVCQRRVEHDVGSAKARFCQECGGSVITVAAEAPTEKFVAYAASLSMTPDRAWEYLLDDEDDEDDERIGLHRIEAIVDPNVRSPKYGLGFRLAVSGSHRGTHYEPTPVDIDLTAKVSKISAWLNKFGAGGRLVRLVRLYPYAYLSY